MRRARALLVIGASLGLSTGCRDGLERFDTGPNEAYCGSVVSGTFVREGFPVELRLRATIDTDNLTTIPGTLSTNDTDPEIENPCLPSARLKDSPMRATDALLHDQLSSFEFGTGRDHNFFAWVDSSCEGPYLAVVSLMRNDDVEVRLMKPPAPAADAGAGPAPAGFALFQLGRQKGDCGF